MKIVLLSRYPGVDTRDWKRRLGTRLLEQGAEISLVYSRSHLTDQLSAGLKQFGPSLPRKYLALRSGKHALGPSSSAPPAPNLATWAREHDLEVSLHRRLDDSDCLERLRAIAPDVIVLAGADIVPRAVLEIPAIGTLNGHYGLLPRYRGMNVTEWSIFHDDPVGVTIHYVDRGIDTGAIVSKELIPVESGEGLEDLRRKHQQSASRQLAEACRRLSMGHVKGVPQRASEGRQYYRMHPALRTSVERRLANGIYRWLDVPADSLHERVRASEAAQP